MSYVVEFSFDHSSSPLTQFVTEYPDSKIRIEYSTPIGTMDSEFAVIIIVSDTNWDEIDAALTADTSVRDSKRLFSVHNHAVYTFEWETGGLHLLYETAQLGVFIERVWTQDGEWCVRIHIPSKDVLETLRTRLEEYEFDITIETIRRFESPQSHGSPTISQIKMIQEAHEEGYFQVPRKITQSELAERHGISESAVSQQVRRGLENVLNEFFTFGPPSTEPFDSNFFTDAYDEDD